MRIVSCFARMKRPINFVLIATILAGCSKHTAPSDASTAETVAPPAATSEYPTLIIDEKHQIHGSNTPAAYQITAATGIRLDATQFHFTYGTNAVGPNMVQFVGAGSAYRLARPAETNIYVIDHTTLEAVRGGLFRGFRPGDQIMFAIGLSTNSTPDKEDFWVSWAGQIEVK